MIITVKRIFRRSKLVFIAVLIVVCVIFLFRRGMSEDISCYYSDLGDALPRIDKTSKLPSKSIFFHETSCRGGLNSRQACSVESTARTHLNWQINVLFLGPVTEKNLNNGSLNALKQFMNVKLFRLHLLQYAKGTPVESLVSQGALNKIRWPITTASDLLRYLTLYKWGGVYLDLDQVAVRSFEDLGDNWAAREATAVAAGALCIAKDPLGRFVADALVSDFKAEYKVHKWGHVGPGAITRVLKKMCNTNNISEMSADRCNGFKVYGSELFYPVSWWDARLYFGAKDLKVKESLVYSHHVWNKHTAKYDVPRNSVYARLAKKYCPTIYKLYGDQFGK